MCLFRAIALCAVIAAPRPAAAQVERNTKPFTPFRVSVVDGILNTTMPFDVKFIVWGHVPAETTDVTLDIRTLRKGTDCSVTGATTPKQRTRVKPRKWKAEDYVDHGTTAPDDLNTRTERQFELLVEELRPSSMYCFTFELKPGHEMTPEEAAELSVVLLPAYRAYMQNRTARQLGELGQDEIEPLRREFLRVLLEASGGRLTPKPNTLFDPNANPAVVAREFLIDTQEVFDWHNEAARRLGNFWSGARANARTLFEFGQSQAMQSLVSAPGRTAEQIAAVAFFRGLTADQAVNVLAGLPIGTTNVEVLTDVWHVDSNFPAVENPQFDENTTCPQTGPLALRCQELDLTLRKVNAVRSPAFAGQDQRVFGIVRSQKVDLLNAQNAINRRQNLMIAQLQKIRGSLPTLFTLLTTTNGSAETRKTWYLSMDTGIAVAPVINEVFPYVGTNMYFRPVNTAVPPSSFGTRFSTLFGFTWTDLNKANERTALYGQDAMIVIGAGFRATEWLRFTGGSLVFKGFNPNPLRNRTRIELTPFFSMSADIDVADAL